MGAGVKAPRDFVDDVAHLSSRYRVRGFLPGRSAKQRIAVV